MLKVMMSNLILEVYGTWLNSRLMFQIQNDSGYKIQLADFKTALAKLPDKAHILKQTTAFIYMNFQWQNILYVLLIRFCELMVQSPCA